MGEFTYSLCSLASKKLKVDLRVEIKIQYLLYYWSIQIEEYRKIEVP